MKFSKEVRLGIVVTTAIAVFIWGFNFLKGSNIFSIEREYYAVYQRIDGLVAANPVLLNGFKIGRVSSIYFHPDKSGDIIVKFVIDKEIVDLPEDTKAMIFSSDLLGSKAIALELGENSVYLKYGDTLTSAIEENLKEAVNRQILPLKMKTEELISSVDSAVTIVQEILNTEARENLSKSFKSFKRSFENFEHASMDLSVLVGNNRERLNNIFINIESISANIVQNNQQLSNVINNFSSISDSIAKADFATTLLRANSALSAASEIMNKVNSGEGSLGLLLNNETFYNELLMAATDLNILLLDIRTNPGKYAPLKRRRRSKPLERDSIYYKNMLNIDSAIINSIRKK